jgi:hypothetical protein
MFADQPSQSTLDWRPGDLCVHDLDRPERRERARGAALSGTMPAMHTTALVLFSGGQDSTTCLAQALTRYQRVETIGFDYRQRHSVELQARLKVLARTARAVSAMGGTAGQDHVLDLAVLGQVSETSLTRDMAFKHGANRPAQHLCAGAQPAVPDTGRRAGLPARPGGDRHRCVRDRFFRLPRLPRRHHEGHATGVVAGHGQALPDRDAADVDRQGGHLGPGRIAGRPAAGEPDRRAHPHLLPGRPRTPPRLGLRLWQLPGLRTARPRLGCLFGRVNATCA